MAYTRDIMLVLGGRKAGLTDLRAQLCDTAGSNVGSAVSTGFVEVGNGNYLWHYTAFPDGHRGFVKFYSAADASTVLASQEINPEDAENLDVKTSTRLATGSYTAPANSTIADISSRLPDALTGDGNIKADALKLNGAVPNNLAAGAQMDLVDSPNADALAAIAVEVDDLLSSEHGAGTWGAVGGNGGSLTLTYTLTSSEGGAAIQGATVELYGEAGMLTLLDSQVTNALGVVVFQNLLAGTYYLKRIKSGWSFSNPDTEVVSS